MPARVKIPVIAAGPDGRPVAGATLTVRNRQTGAAATVFAVENPADNTALGAGQMVSDSRGLFPGWTARMRAEGTVTYPVATGLGPEVVQWEANPAGNDDAEADWIDDDATGAGYLAQRNADGTISWVPSPLRRGTYASIPSAVGLTGARYFATDKRMELESDGAAWSVVGAHPIVVSGGSALPSSPVDNQEALLEWHPAAGDGQQGYTRLRYRNAGGSSYRWLCQGGLMALAATSTQNVPSSTPVALSSMQWTATYSGLYRLGFSVLGVILTTTHTLNVDLYVNGAKVDGRSAPGNSGWGPTVVMHGRPFVVNAGQVVELRGYGDGSQDFKERLLTIEPLRLAG